MSRVYGVRDMEPHRDGETKNRYQQLKDYSMVGLVARSVLLTDVSLLMMLMGCEVQGEYHQHKHYDDNGLLAGAALMGPSTVMLGDCEEDIKDMEGDFGYLQSDGYTENGPVARAAHPDPEQRKAPENNLGSLLGDAKSSHFGEQLSVWTKKVAGCLEHRHLGVLRPHGEGHERNRASWPSLGTCSAPGWACWACWPRSWSSPRTGTSLRSENPSHRDLKKLFGQKWEAKRAMPSFRLLVPPSKLGLRLALGLASSAPWLRTMRGGRVATSSGGVPGEHCPPQPPPRVVVAPTQSRRGLETTAFKTLGVCKALPLRKKNRFGPLCRSTAVVILPKTIGLDDASPLGAISGALQTIWHGSWTCPTPGASLPQAPTN